LIAFPIMRDFGVQQSSMDKRIHFAAV